MNRSLITTSSLIARRALMQSRSLSATTIDGPLGFVGLGHMGGKMVENLSKDGRKIMVYDANKEAVNKVVAASASGNKSVSAASLDEMSQKCSIIFSMLPNDQVLSNQAIHCSVFVGDFCFLNVIGCGKHLQEPDRRQQGC